MMSPLNIRDGSREDIPHVLALIRELAEYEKAPGEVAVTKEDLLRDGFSENLFRFKIAVQESRPVAMALYYFGYSTWKGKMLYIDDIIVTGEMRRKGIGSLLFSEILKTAKTEGARQVRFHVLNWNTPALAFYKKFGTAFDPEWITCRIAEPVIKGINS